MLLGLCMHAVHRLACSTRWTSTPREPAARQQWSSTALKPFPPCRLQIEYPILDFLENMKAKATSCCKRRHSAADSDHMPVPRRDSNGDAAV